MALLPTGSDKLIEIRTKYVDLEIKRKGVPAPLIKDNGAVSSVKVSGADIEQICIPAQSISEEYADHKGIAVHNLKIGPLFFEQTDYTLTIRSRNNEKLEFHSNSSLIEKRISNFMDDPSLLSGVINYGNNVGFSDLVILANGMQVLAVRLEVYPTKVSYKKDYQEMMADINDMVSESILDFMKKTHQVFVPNHKHNEVPAVFFTVLQTIYGKYIQAINRIISVPNHKLTTEYEIMPFYKAKRTDSKSERWLEKHPGYVLHSPGTIRAEKILSARKEITYDTAENQLVKFMLRSTVNKIEDFRKRYVSRTNEPEKRILSEVRGMETEIKRLLTTTFLSKVSEYRASRSMSLVFGMAPGYRELYKYYLLLQNGLSVGGDIFRMSVRETAQLYEYWCFIKLYDILRTRYILKSPDIIKVDRSGVTVDIAKGKTSTVKFINPDTGERIFLSYNPSEANTQTVNQRPDNVLELSKNGIKTAYKYVFDAKYRIEMNPDGKYYPDTKPGPKMDDINTMHRYRDSIVYENPDSRFTFEKTMFGAYILFPYSDEEEYKGHRFYKSIGSVNIGGLPFLPSATDLVTKLLDELVSDSPETAFERATLPIGIEERIKKVDWERRDVLIGLVSDENHMKLFLENRCYLTDRFDTAHLPVRYIALYEKGRGIYKYGEVINWRKLENTDALSKTNNGGSSVHEFEVLDWKDLDSPVSSLESGPNPTSYTNYFLLSNSSVYSELLLKNEADYRLYYELKRRTNDFSVSGEEAATVLEKDNVKVMIDSSDIYLISKEGKSRLFSVQTFNRKPNAMFKRLQMYLAEVKAFF